MLHSAKRAPANVRWLNNISDVIFYCSVGERSRALALLNAALIYEFCSVKTFKWEKIVYRRNNLMYNFVMTNNEIRTLSNKWDIPFLVEIAFFFFISASSLLSPIFLTKNWHSSLKSRIINAITEGIITFGIQYADGHLGIEKILCQLLLLGNWNKNNGWM